MKLDEAKSRGYDRLARGTVYACKLAQDHVDVDRKAEELRCHRRSSRSRCLRTAMS